jgi:hypothetical protein
VTRDAIEADREVTGHWKRSGRAEKAMAPARSVVEGITVCMWGVVPPNLLSVLFYIHICIYNNK